MEETCRKLNLPSTTMRLISRYNTFKVFSTPQRYLPVSAFSSFFMATLKTPSSLPLLMLYLPWLATVDRLLSLWMRMLSLEQTPLQKYMLLCLAPLSLFQLPEQRMETSPPTRPLTSSTSEATILTAAVWHKKAWLQLNTGSNQHTNVVNTNYISCCTDFFIFSCIWKKHFISFKLKLDVHMTSWIMPY